MLGEPSARFGERFSRQLTVGDAADLRARDQAGPFEHTQMLGDRRRRDVERLAQDPDGTRFASQLLEHRSTSGISQCPEHGIKRIDRVFHARP